MSEHRCAEVIYTDRGWHKHQCQRSAVVEESGRWWCKQHAPSAVAARHAKRSARWEAEAAEARAERERNAAVHAACAGVDDPQPGELARLRAEVARLRGE